jgi:hypothetical protein
MKRYTLPIVIVLASLSCAPQATSPPANAEAPAAAPSVAKPVSFKDAMAIFDCRTLKPFPGAYRDSNSPIQSSSSVTVAEGIDLPAVVEHYRSQLLAAGWKDVPFEGSDDVSGSGEQMVFDKQGLRAEFTAGITRGFPSGQDINAGVFLIGNVAPSSLPLPEGARVTMTNPTVVAYETTTPIADLRAFYTKTMKELGWIEYRIPAPGGVTIPWEQVEKQQDFLAGAVGIHVSYYQSQPAEKDTAKNAAKEAAPLTEVLVRPSLVPIDADIPAEAEDLDFQADPLAMVFALRKPLEEATAGYDQMLTKRGYRSAPGEKREKGNNRALDYTAEGLPTLHVEFLWSKPLTFVSVKADGGE